MEAEVPQHPFCVAHKDFQCGVGFFRGDDMDQFNLVELMHPDHAPGVLARAARLATETGRVGRVADRQLFHGNNFLAMEVGYGDFGRGHEIERRLFFHAVHVLGKFRQLPGAGHAFAADEKGGRNFGVAMFAGVEVEEVIDERAFQPCAESLEEDEAAARNFGRRFEINQAELRADFPVRFRLEIEGRRFANDSFDAVLLRAVADRHRVVVDVGNAEQEVGQFGLASSNLLINLGDLFSHRLHLRGNFGDVAALGLDRADFLAGAVALALERFAFLQMLAALFVQGQNVGDQFFIAGVAAGEAFPVIIGVFANFSYV